MQSLLYEVVRRTFFEHGGRHGEADRHLQESLRPVKLQRHLEKQLQGLIDEFVSTAEAGLYLGMGRTAEEESTGVFRYKALLYDMYDMENSDAAAQQVQARLGSMGDLWGCVDRSRANRIARYVAQALDYVPGSRKLRWLLLDIYYEMARAEETLAREQRATIAQMVIDPAGPDESPIDKEIAML